VVSQWITCLGQSDCALCAKVTNDFYMLTPCLVEDVVTLGFVCVINISNLVLSFALSLSFAVQNIPQKLKLEQ